MITISLILSRSFITSAPILLSKSVDILVVAAFAAATISAQANFDMFLWTSPFRQVSQLITNLSIHHKLYEATFL
ncbi:hypothetical protein EUGRSUZ_F02204 [Eucalyptus grandis]|uniref:Uncharacterized protein n=2 Tax=Eucalyptus grandis TaxID=71139 RepID=A0ACC3KIW8_EUCGR|nr:hypothetical protein EUGRSUZ_F02204 [Eucalyptus grandis]